MNSNWKDYFTFTKKERIGICMLIAGIAITVAVPYFYASAPLPDKATIEAFHLQKAQLEKIKWNKERPYTEKREAYAEVYFEPAGEDSTATLFPFDPNTLNEAGWKKLGLNKRIIHTIQNYTSKGGRFHKPADLQKIYGLRKADYERLKPWIQITDTVVLFANRTSIKRKEQYVKLPPPIVDVNEADTSAFIALPGIGSKLANRIVQFREKLGGFYSVEQLAETYGLPDSTYRLIKPQLQCSGTPIRKININRADANTLKQHPYIKWNIANAIVTFREQHGPYDAPDDLQQIAIITPELYEKIMRYVAVE